MADGVLNIALGAFVEKFRDLNARGIVLLLKANEAEDDLLDHDDLASLLAAAGNTEANFSNYARKTGLTATITVDDVNNRVDCDMPDQTWSSAGGGVDNNLTKALVAYEETASDAGRVVISHHDFIKTTDGFDMTLEFDSVGFARAGR